MQAAIGGGISPLVGRGLAAARCRHQRLLGNAAPGVTPAPLQWQRRAQTHVERDQQHQARHGDLQVVCAGAAGDTFAYPPPSPYAPSSFGDPNSLAGGRLSEPARAALARATRALKRYGWLAFWVQLTLSVVSGVILLFSVAFTSQSGPKASLYLTLVGILAGFLSTFWALGYQRVAGRMQEYLDGADVARIKKQTVMENVTRGVLINLVGMGSTLLGISTLVGLLVAKTLSNASVNPFMASAAGAYNPVLALDVFLVQAATNTLLGHFLSLLCSLWLLNVIGEGRGGLRFSARPGTQPMAPIKEGDESGVTGRSMSGSLYRIGGGMPGMPGSGGGGGGAGGGGYGGIAGAWPQPR